MSERKALLFSVVGMAVMAISGIGFALVSHSEAILLDGVFSTIGMFLSLLTLKIAELVRRPDDEHFHFGYAHFTPLLNLIKALLMVVLCVFALISAIEAAIGGGRELALGYAVVYGVIATFACLASALILKRAAKRLNSELVSVDAQSWVVDTAISSAVMFGFLAGFVVDGTRFAHLLPYLDPVIVTILVVIAVPVPLQILFRSLKEVLLMAPPGPYQDQVREKIDQALSHYPVDDKRVRLLKMGNTINILLHVKLSDDFRFESHAAMDEIHWHVERELQSLPDRAIVDLVFVGDMAVAE